MPVVYDKGPKRGIAGRQDSWRRNSDDAPYYTTQSGKVLSHSGREIAQEDREGVFAEDAPNQSPLSTLPTSTSSSYIFGGAPPNMLRRRSRLGAGLQQQQQQQVNELLKRVAELEQELESARGAVGLAEERAEQLEQDCQATIDRQRQQMQAQLTSDRRLAADRTSALEQEVHHLREQLDVLTAEKQSLEEKLSEQQGKIEDSQKELSSSNALHNQIVKLLSDNNKKTSDELSHVQTEHQKEINSLRALVEEKVVRIQTLERLLEHQQAANLGTNPNPMFRPVAPAVADVTLDRAASITPAPGTSNAPDPGTSTPKRTSTTNVKKRRQPTSVERGGRQWKSPTSSPHTPAAVALSAYAAREIRALRESAEKFIDPFDSSNQSASSTTATFEVPPPLSSTRKNLGRTLVRASREGAPAVASSGSATTAARQSSTTTTPPKKRSRISVESGPTTLLNLPPPTKSMVVPSSSGLLRFMNFPPPRSSSSSRRRTSSSNSKTLRTSS